MGDGGDLASFGSRVGALLIDVVLVAIVGAVFVLASGIDRRHERLVFVAIQLLQGLVYATPLLCRSGARNGQTLGKQALGIRVVRVDAAPVTLETALLREFVGRAALGLIPVFTIVDYLFPLGDTRRQAIHDKIATTFVVRADAVPQLEEDEPPPAGEAARAFGSDESTPPPNWGPPRP